MNRIKTALVLFVGLMAATASAQMMQDHTVTVIQGRLQRCVIVAGLPPEPVDDATKQTGRDDGQTILVVPPPAVHCWTHIEFSSSADDPFVVISEQ